MSGVIFVSSTMAYADDWEGIGIVGTNPNKYDIPTFISFEDAPLHFVNNTNVGSILFSYSLTPWDGSITNAMASVGFNTACNFKLEVEVSFRVPNAGIEIQAGVINNNAQNLVPFIDIAGRKFIFDLDEVHARINAPFDNMHAFDYPNDITSDGSYGYRMYASNSNKYAMLVYSTQLLNNPAIYDGDYPVITQRIILYYYSSSGTVDSVPGEVVRKLENTLFQSEWRSVGYAYIAALMTQSNIGESSADKDIENYISAMEVHFKKGTLTASDIEHIYSAMSAQDKLLYGRYEDWLLLQQTKEELNVLDDSLDALGDYIKVDFDGNINNILSELSYPAALGKVITSVFYTEDNDTTILYVLALLSINLSVISLVLYGTHKG